MSSRPQFSFGADSVASSRSASPAPSFDTNDEPSEYEDVSPGQRSTDVYDLTLPPWRAYVRRKLVQTVQWESRVIANMQVAIRTPWLDKYFIYSSLLGTHTFFMVMLPMFAFFGRQDIARDLIYVLAAGVYLTSVLKDMFCAPRPFAPPVVRLTIGSHHLEYGFPSTHSTNSVSMALFFFSMAHSLDSITNIQFYVFSLILAVYAASVVFGRLYTAMHSFTDCIVGCILGAGIWWGHGSWAGLPLVLSSSNPVSSLLTAIGIGQSLGHGQFVVYIGKGLGAGRWLEHWAENGGWEVPLILIPLALLAVNQHPQPVDDCPCFEDAIAFGSVVLGALVGRWAMNTLGLNCELGGPSIMPGSGWVRDSSGVWMSVETTWADNGLWWTIAITKMVVGILTIFVWRIVAKSALHAILPPTFRLLSRAFSLPNRRFYTPATEYKNVPSDIQVQEDGTIALHAIPSVIDLPSSAGFTFETGGIGSGVDSGSNSTWPVRRSKKVKGGGAVLDGSRWRDNDNDSSPTLDEKDTARVKYPDEERLDNKAKRVKHYDAEVLTKVIVYAGIAVLACEALPLFFERVGWGLRYSA